MRPAVLWEVLSFQPSQGEEGMDFMLEGWLENIPQFVLGVYSLTHVTVVGVSDPAGSVPVFGWISVDKTGTELACMAALYQI